MEGTESGDAAVKVEAQKLRADNTFLAEELCFTAQQVLEVSILCSSVRLVCVCAGA